MTYGGRLPVVPVSYHFCPEKRSFDETRDFEDFDACLRFSVRFYERFCINLSKPKNPTLNPATERGEVLKEVSSINYLGGAVGWL